MLQVLIVDDDNVVVFIQKKMILKHEIAEKPLSFKKATDALEYLNNHRNPEVHFLVLLDINMPYMSGWEFLKKIESHPLEENLHIIMVTSSIAPKDKEKALAHSNVIGFLEKPISNKDCERMKELPEIALFFQNQD